MPLIYIGDGRNDFCPGRYLGKNDLFCVRNGFSLAKLLLNEEHSSKISSKIIYWTNANEIINHL